MRARNYDTEPERIAFFDTLAAERSAGLTLAAIGRKWNLSAQRVSGCLRYRRLWHGLDAAEAPWESGRQARVDDYPLERR